MNHEEKFEEYYKELKDKKLLPDFIDEKLLHSLLGHSFTSGFFYGGIKALELAEIKIIKNKLPDLREIIGS